MDNSGAMPQTFWTNFDKSTLPNHEGLNFGVDVNQGILDTFALIWEPVSVGGNTPPKGGEATCLILSIDETVLKP